MESISISTCVDRYPSVNRLNFKRIKDSSIHGLKILMLFASSLIAINLYASNESDIFLANQMVNDEKVIPELIEMVREDVQKSVFEQIEKHEKLAQQQSSFIQLNSLESGASSDNELRKKTDNDKLVSTEKKPYVPSKYKSSDYFVGGENMNMLIRNESKVTITSNPVPH